MDPSDQQQQQHHQGATATKAPGFPPSPPQHHHQRRRSALEGAAAASPLVVGPGGIALLRLGGTGSPARLRSGSAGSGIGIGTGGSVDSPTRAAAVAGPLGGSSPLSSYALRVMRERAAAAAATSATAGGKGGGGDGASAAVEEKGDYSVLSSGHQGTRRSSTSVGDGKARLSSLSYAAGAPSPPSANKSPAAPVRIRSVEEDDEDGEETPAAHGGCGHACGGDGHHGLSTLASASGSGSGSSSSSSGSMCCRNCGSSEVVKVRGPFVAIGGTGSVRSSPRSPILTHSYQPFCPRQKVPLSASSPSKGDGGLVGPNTTAALRAASLASGLPVSTCKLLVVGNAKCGKTSVIRRFVQGSFENVRFVCRFGGLRGRVHVYVCMMHVHTSLWTRNIHSNNHTINKYAGLRLDGRRRLPQAGRGAQGRPPRPPAGARGTTQGFVLSSTTDRPIN